MKPKLTKDDIKAMFPNFKIQEINWLFASSNSISEANHNHSMLLNMKRQSEASPSEVQNAKAVIIDYYMTGTMTKNTETPIPETPKVSTIEKGLTDIIACRRYIQAYENARDRGIDFQLTISDVKRLMRKTRCHYTGILFDHSIVDFRPSFDRVDKNKPYTKDNVVMCMTAVNHLKNDLLEKEGALFLGRPDLLLKTIVTMCKTMDKKS
jgi:hypothetical protein